MIHLTYFVHGTTTDNEAGISSGWKDCDLSALGVEQSLQLKKTLSARNFDAVFCSDLLRARRSADMTFGKDIAISDQRLRECNYGDYNGQPSAVVEPLQEKNITTAFPQGESCEDVKKRLADFLTFLKKEHDGRSIAVVAHKIPQLALEVLVCGKTWSQAFADDWRKTKAWQPGWQYKIK